jgi:2-polyprenyl-3-methyl-5-hydroxy-6-metoxy-1,4-benzoquinol methylase
MGCEQMSQYYNEVYDKEKRYQGHYSDSPHLMMYKIAEGLLAEVWESHILDLGCGTGQFAHYLWDNGYMTYLGVDFSETAIGIAHGLSPQAFEVADVRTYEPKWEDFNTVVMLEVLEHLTDDLELIKKIPEGKDVIFSVPNFDDPAHVRHFTSKEEVYARYDNLINIDKMIAYGYWIICKGVRNG